MEKSKAEKSPWAKINKKRGPKKKVRAPFLQEKKNILAESNKGSLFDQEPLTSSASAEDPQRSKIIGASSLKIKVSADRKQDCSSESNRTNAEKEESESSGSKNWSIVDRDELNRQLAGRVTRSFCQSEGVKFEEVARTGLGVEWICRCSAPHMSWCHHSTQRLRPTGFTM